MSLKDEFLLDPSVTFLNHGSFGACPRPVFERYQAWQRELEREPVHFLARRIGGLLAAARAALAGYVGAAADDLTFVPNATTGVNLAARSLGLGPGDEVLATDLEYGACDLAWEWLCERSGARYVRAEIPLPLASPGDVVDALYSRRSERTRAVYVSHVTSETALLLPVEDIVARARGEGLVTIVDGAHAPGHVPLRLDELGADFYAGNCHKWRSDSTRSDVDVTGPRLCIRRRGVVRSEHARSWLASSASVRLRAASGPAPRSQRPGAFALRGARHGRHRRACARHRSTTGGDPRPRPGRVPRARP